MSHLDTPNDLPRDERRTLHLPEPRTPGRGTLRSLAQAGLSDRGLRVISSRKAAKAIRAELQEEATRRRAELYAAERAAKRRAAIRSMMMRVAPWLVIGVVSALLTRRVGLISLPVAAGVVVSAGVLGPLVWRALRKKPPGASEGS